MPIAAHRMDHDAASRRLQLIFQTSHPLRSIHGAARTLLDPAIVRFRVTPRTALHAATHRVRDDADHREDRASDERARSAEAAKQQSWIHHPSHARARGRRPQAVFPHPSDWASVRRSVRPQLRSVRCPLCRRRLRSSRATRPRRRTASGVATWTAKALDLAQRGDDWRRAIRRNHFNGPSSVQERLVAHKPMKRRRRAIEAKEPREDVVQIENAAAHLRRDRSAAPTPAPYIARADIQQERHGTRSERATQSS